MKELHFQPNRIIRKKATGTQCAKTGALAWLLRESSFNVASAKRWAAQKDCSAVPTSRQSMTSSALATIAGGIVKPSVSMVLLLITRRKRVGCSNGRSAGASPPYDR